MALIGDTGQGGTATFGTSALAFAWDNIAPSAQTRAMLDVNKLSTTAMMERVASDLTDPGTITFDYIFVETSSAPTVGGAAESVTITYPAGATLIGTGVITSWTPPTMQIGNIMKGQIVVSFDGDTGPAFTADS